MRSGAARQQATRVRDLLGRRVSGTLSLVCCCRYPILILQALEDACSGVVLLARAGFVVWSISLLTLASLVRSTVLQCCYPGVIENFKAFCSPDDECQSAWWVPGYPGSLIAPKLPDWGAYKHSLSQVCLFKNKLEGLRLRLAASGLRTITYKYSRNINKVNWAVMALLGVVK